MEEFGSSMRAMRKRLWQVIELGCDAPIALLFAAVVPLAACGLIDTSQVAHYGYIDKSGGFVIPPHFDIAREFSEDRAVVGERIGPKVPSYYRWGFIDKSGKIVINPQFKAVNSFHEGLAAVVLQSGKMGYIDKQGRIAIPTMFDSSQYLTMDAYETAPAQSDFSNGRAVVWINGKAAVIDPSGAFVVKPGTHSRIGGESEHMLAFADENELYGYLDMNGHVAIQPQFNSASAFSEGLAAVEIRDRANRRNRRCYIDKTGKIVLEDKSWFALTAFKEGLAMVVVKNDAAGYKFIDGFIDKTGKFVIPAKFAYASAFKEGRALAGTAPGTYGYIDKSGNWAIPANFHSMMFYGFSEGLAAVPAGWIGNREWGYIDPSGKQVIPPNFALPSRVEPGVADFHEGLAAVGIPEHK
jgi:hypothetical protein